MFQSRDTVKIARLDVQVFRFPLSQPVITSFGHMTSRPAVFVRLEDGDGAFGWGEIFANWPAAGAEHRARLLMEDIADLVVGETFGGREALFATLQRKTHIRALQCGEPGPFNHVIAGLDTAFNDLLARKRGLPLRLFLSPDAADEVPVYASGINLAGAESTIESCRSSGFSAFKIKVGFDAHGDIERVWRVHESLASDENLSVDANQGWDVTGAATFLEATGALDLRWVEEPIPADSPLEDWIAVARASSAPIAAGENISGFDGFERAVGAGVFGILQPDVAKWGGVTGCWRVACSILDRQVTYCPHFLGGGIGLVASAHLLAAVGGGGVLEFDVNPNPARDAFLAQGQSAIGSGMVLSDAPGLGIEHIPEELGGLKTYAKSLSI